MRRKEKLISNRHDIDAVIHECQVCRLAFAMDQTPYIVPLAFGYDGRHLFFHTAKEGRKITFLKANSLVCFEFEHNVRLKTSGADPCAWGFTFETVIGQGHMRELTDSGDIQRGLQHIVDHYADTYQQMKPEAMSQVLVWCLTIDSINGKRS